MKKIILLSLACVALFSCKKEGPKEALLGEVVFNANIDVTKATFDKAAFADGDKVVVWITDNADLVNQYNYVDKANYEYNNNKFQVPTGQSKILFPTSNSSLKFWAISPADIAPDKLTDDKQFVHNIIADQTVEANYKKSDLLTAQNTSGVAFGGNVPVLNFLHRMSKVVVKITSVPATYEGQALTSVAVEMRSADKVTVKMVATTDAVIADATAGLSMINVKMNNSDAATNSFEAIVAPRNYSVDEAMFYVKATYGSLVKEMQYTAKKVENIIAGGAFQFDVAISAGFEITTTFGLTEWTPESGEPGTLKPQA